MAQQFFERPILNSPYEQPSCHWELDDDGQPTGVLVESRRRSDLITPVPKPKKRKRKSAAQLEMTFDAGDDLSSVEQEYNPTPIINEVRTYDLDGGGFEPGVLYANNALLAELLRGCTGWSMIDIHSGVYLLGTRHPHSNIWIKPASAA